MALDPNWFYSTLAQSTAAIVGLGGGFLVQRILHQRNEIAAPRAELHRETVRRYQEIAAARQSADQVALSLSGAADDGRAHQAAGGQNFRVTRDVFAYTRDHGVQGRGNGLAVVLDFTFISHFAEAGEAAANFRDALPASLHDYVRTIERHGRLVSPEAPWLQEVLAPIPPSGPPEPFLDHVAHQRDHLRHWWRGLQTEAQRLAEDIHEFRSRLVPESFNRLLAVISLLLVSGTIAPMLYLSARSEGSRALLLIPFALLSLAFFAFIAGELRQLRTAGDMTRDDF